MDLFKPNIKKILITIPIFLICSFIMWIQSVQIILKFGSSAFDILNFNVFLYLPIILLISYFLSAIFIHYFDWTYLKKISLPLKLIILYLLFKLFGVTFYMLSNIRSSSGNNIVQTSYLLFSNLPTLYLILLITSIIFVSIKIKYNWIFGSLYFLYTLFNPLSFQSQISAQGLIISSFQALLLGDLRTSLIMIISSCFYIIIVIYLAIAVRNSFKSKEFGKIMFILLITSYVINQFNLAVATFAGYGLNLPIFQSLIFFSLLVGWHYYSQKSL